MNRLLLRAMLVTFDTISVVHRAAYKLPLVERIEDIVLDTILGPAEDHDYVSTTAPSSPPPRL